MEERDEVRVCRVGDGTQRLRALGVIVGGIALVLCGLTSNALGWPGTDGAADEDTSEVASPRGTRRGLGMSATAPADVFRAWLDYRAGEREQLCCTPAQVRRAWLDYRAEERGDPGDTSPVVPTRECPPTVEDTSVTSRSHHAAIGTDSPQDHHWVLGYWVRNGN